MKMIFVLLLLVSISGKSQVVSFQSDSLLFSLRLFGNQKSKIQITLVNKKQNPIFLSGTNKTIVKTIAKIKNAIGIIVEPGAFTGNLAKFSAPLIIINPGDTLKDMISPMMDYFTNKPISRKASKLSISISYLNFAEIEPNAISQNMISGELFLRKMKKIYCESSLICE